MQPVRLKAIENTGQVFELNSDQIQVYEPCRITKQDDLEIVFVLRLHLQPLIRSDVQ